MKIIVKTETHLKTFKNYVNVFKLFVEFMGHNTCLKKLLLE